MFFGLTKGHSGCGYSAANDGQATKAGFVYVAFVIDVFARRIIGWRVARSMRAQLVVDALEQALWSRSGVQDVVHHSDRLNSPWAGQYLSIRYSERLAEAGA